MRVLRDALKEVIVSSRSFPSGSKVDSTDPNLTNNRSGLKQRSGTGKLSSSAAIAAATKAVQQLEGAALDDIDLRLKEIETKARSREADCESLIYDQAHEVRGIAGTFDLRSLGIIADCICHYIENKEQSDKVDANLITLLATAARLVAKPGMDAESLSNDLVSECRELTRRVAR